MIPDACFTPSAQGWQRPTPEEIREYLDGHGITPYRASQLLGVGKMTPHRWLSGEIAIKFADWSALVRAVEFSTGAPGAAAGQKIESKLLGIYKLEMIECLADTTAQAMTSAIQAASWAVIKIGCLHCEKESTVIGFYRHDEATKMADKLNAAIPADEAGTYVYAALPIGEQGSITPP